MKAKDFIYQSIIRYPLIFPTKWHVMEHAFLVIGNGLEWKNGEIVDEYSEFDYLTKEDAIELQKKENEDFYKRNPHLNKYKHSKGLDKLISIIENGENLASEDKCNLKILDQLTREYNKEFHEGKVMSLYPISKHSLLVNIPDDIQDDWKELIKEFYREVLKPSIEAGIYTMKGQFEDTIYGVPDWVTE